MDMSIAPNAHYESGKLPESPELPKNAKLDPARNSLSAIFGNFGNSGNPDKSVFIRGKVLIFYLL
jgi:hypothetical protein